MTFVGFPVETGSAPREALGGFKMMAVPTAAAAIQESYGFRKISSSRTWHQPVDSLPPLQHIHGTHPFDPCGRFPQN